MGLFDKLKNILFEEDEEDNTMTDIPVYNKKDIKEEKISEIKKDVKPVINDENTNQIDNSRFRNVKKDIDLSFSDEEVTPKVNSEAQQTKDIVSELKREVQAQREEKRIEEIKTPVEKPLPQRRSVFQSFDAEEFDKQNQRSNELELKRREEFRKREEAIKKEKEERISMNEARMANSNFSSTTPTRKETDPERYKINSETHQGKKPFRPSPVISPVYGILDKNYTADEIVDKTDGMKREKLNTIVRTPDIASEVKPKEEPEVKTIEDAYNEYEEEKKEISIESVRNKAFGHEEEVPAEFNIDEEDTIVDDIEEVIEEINEEELLEDKEEIIETPAEIIETPVEEPIVEETEEDLRAKFVKDDSFSKREEKSTLLDDEPSYVPEDEFEEEEDIDSYEGDSLLDVEDTKVSKNHILDDMEKTSTLQILDDIEKELNSIKTVVNEESNNDYTDEERLERNDTLENDLFKLIDSMYDNGEEDEDND